MGKFKFPTAYTILFVLIALVAAMTWIVPAGKYQMVTNAALGRKFLLQVLTHLLRHNHRVLRLSC